MASRSAWSWRHWRRMTRRRAPFFRRLFVRNFFKRFHRLCGALPFTVLFDALARHLCKPITLLFTYSRGTEENVAKATVRDFRRKLSFFLELCGTQAASDCFFVKAACVPQSSKKKLSL